MWKYRCYFLWNHTLLNTVVVNRGRFYHWDAGDAYPHYLHRDFLYVKSTVDLIRYIKLRTESKKDECIMQWLALTSSHRGLRWSFGALVVGVLLEFCWTFFDLLDFCWTLFRLLLDFLLNFCWSFVGRFVEVLLEFCWSFVGDLLEFCWTFVELLPDFCWTFVDLLFEFCRTFCWTFAELCWTFVGLFVGDFWSYVGVLLDLFGLLAPPLSALNHGEKTEKAWVGLARFIRQHHISLRFS